MYETGLDAGTRPEAVSSFNPEQARGEMAKLLFTARRSRHIFLIYLLGLVLEEIRNIESGRPSNI
jgi:hypothetical protein